MSRRFDQPRSLFSSFREVDGWLDKAQQLSKKLAELSSSTVQEDRRLDLLRRFDRVKENLLEGAWSYIRKLDEETGAVNFWDHAHASRYFRKHKIAFPRFERFCAIDGEQAALAAVTFGRFSLNNVGMIWQEQSEQRKREEVFDFVKKYADLLTRSQDEEKIYIAAESCVDLDRMSVRELQFSKEQITDNAKIFVQAVKALPSKLVAQKMDMLLFYATHEAHSEIFMEHCAQCLMDVVEELPETQRKPALLYAADQDFLVPLGKKNVFRNAVRNKLENEKIERKSFKNFGQEIFDSFLPFAKTESEEKACDGLIRSLEELPSLSGRVDAGISVLSSMMNGGENICCGGESIQKITLFLLKSISACPPEIKENAARWMLSGCKDYPWISVNDGAKKSESLGDYLRLIVRDARRYATRGPISTLDASPLEVLPLFQAKAISVFSSHYKFGGQPKGKIHKVPPKAMTMFSSPQNLVF